MGEVVVGNLNPCQGWKWHGQQQRCYVKIRGSYKNGNGKILIEFCVQNELVVMNTCFHHKDIINSHEKRQDVVKNHRLPHNKKEP